MEPIEQPYLGPLPELIWFQTFLVVAGCRSYEQAGIALGLNRSNVLRRVQSLEAWLGEPLFNGGVPLGILPAGERHLPFARQLVRIAAETKHRMPAAIPPKPPKTSGRDVEVP